MPYMTETEVSNLHQVIERLEARLKEAEAVIKPIYVKHTQDAVNVNFQLCGCDYCEAYRKVFEKGAA